MKCLNHNEIICLESKWKINLIELPWNFTWTIKQFLHLLHLSFCNYFSAILLKPLTTLLLLLRYFSDLKLQPLLKISIRTSKKTGNPFQNFNRNCVHREKKIRKKKNWKIEEFFFIFFKNDLEKIIFLKNFKIFFSCPFKKFMKSSNLFLKPPEKPRLSFCKL